MRQPELIIRREHKSTSAYYEACTSANNGTS